MSSGASVVCPSFQLAELVWLAGNLAALTRPSHVVIPNPQLLPRTQSSLALSLIDTDSPSLRGVHCVGFNANNETAGFRETLLPSNSSQDSSPHLTGLWMAQPIQHRPPRLC